MVFEPESKINVYVGRVRAKVSNFPAYNHWPVSQVLSDGRFALAADRAASFSISYVDPPRHCGQEQTYWSSLLYGTTEWPSTELVNLAKSCLSPPEFKIRKGAFEEKQYDQAQKAYMLKCKEPGKPTILECDILASPETPLANICLFIEGWGDLDIRLRIDGKEARRNEDYCIGYVRNLAGSDLVVWIKKFSTRPIKSSFSPSKDE